MGYTDGRFTMKWWDPHTKKLKYFSFEKFNEHKNEFCKVWSPGSERMIGTKHSTLTTLKIEVSYHPL